MVSGGKRWITSRATLPSSSRGRWLASGLVGALIASAGTQITLDEMTDMPDGAAFRIGDAATSEKQLEHRVELMKALYGVQRPTEKKKVDKFTRDTAKAVAVSHILDKAAVDRGIVVPEKSATDELDKVVQQSYPQGRREFITKLGQVGVSQKDVTSEIKRQLANARLYKSVTKSVKPVSDDQLKKTFDKRKSQMVSPEQRHLRNIVVATKEDATRVLEQAEDGEDFAKLAEKTSQDASTKAKGGDLGFVSTDQLEKAYSDKAFSAKTGTVFGPVKTKSGWNVGKVLEEKPSKPLKFKKVEKAFRTQLDNERRSRVWNSWLANEIKSADVEYADKYRPADPTAPPKVQP